MTSNLESIWILKAAYCPFFSVPQLPPWNQPFYDIWKTGLKGEPVSYATFPMVPLSCILPPLCWGSAGLQESNVCGAGSIDPAILGLQYLSHKESEKQRLKGWPVETWDLFSSSLDLFFQSPELRRMRSQLLLLNMLSNSLSSVVASKHPSPTAFTSFLALVCTAYTAVLD